MPTIVQIKLIVEIPSEAVYFRLIVGGGFNGGVKCSPSATVDLDKFGDSAFSVPPLSWSATHRYSDSDTLNVPSKPNWFRTLKPNARPIETKTLLRTTENLNVTATQIAGATHAVKFFVNGGNPLLPAVSPDIDATITVGLRKNSNRIQYTIEGSHDAFPNYSVEINQKNVYAWDAVVNNADPSDLGDIIGENVSIPWTNI